MKPSQGYGLQSQANVIDSYQNYSNYVVNQDELWNNLLTEAGRQAVGAQMAKL